MYKSHLQHAIGSKATAIIDGVQKAVIYDVSPCDETNGMRGLLVCVRAYDEDEGETFSFERGPDDRLICFYDLGEFIPLQPDTLMDFSCDNCNTDWRGQVTSDDFICPNCSEGCS